MAAIALVEPRLSGSGHRLVRNEKTKIYQMGDLMVAPSLSDSMLGYAYLRFEAEKLLPLIFHDGVPTLTWFLRRFQEAPELGPVERVRTLGCYVGDALWGLGWTNAIAQIGQTPWRKGEVGMACFRKLHPEKALTFGQMMLTWAFRELDLGVIYETTPVPNVSAVRFLKRLGFDFCGQLPRYSSWDGRLCDSWISAMTRDRWFSDLFPEGADAAA